MKQNPLTILFSGQPETVTLRDGSKLQVFVRELPERYLLGHFLNVMEFGSSTVELCTYLAAEAGKEPPPAAYPDVPAPSGYWAVPPHWADNLKDDSLAKLYELAKKINFDRAAKLAKGRLAAKKMIAPLNATLLEQVKPLVVAVLNELQGISSSSTRKSQSSPATPASSAYPLTFPTVHVADVKVRRVFFGARFDNPVTGSAQVQKRGPKRFEIDVTLQPMSRADASTTKFAQFLDDLSGGFGTFTFNLDPWCVGMDPLPGSRTFRLATNEHSWSASVAEMGFSFSAIEVL